MKRKNKISGIIAIVLAANLLFAPLALAQPVLPSTPTVPTGSNTNQVVPTQSSTGATPSTGINKAAWEAAQKDQAACMKFKDDLWNASKTAFKATWYDKGPQQQSAASQAQYGNWGVETNTTVAAQSTGTRCFVISGWEGDWGPNNPNVRTRVSATLETNIKQSTTGITAADFAEWQRKDNAERTAAGGISALIGTVLDTLLSVFAVFLGMVASIAGQIFSYAVSQAVNEMILPSAVTIGWSIMRDISNMVFILILIVMALAAILRLEEYDYRHLMGEVVIMAILVNFSQVIALTLVNFVNFLTAIFWNDLGFLDIFATMLRVANPGNAILEGYRGGWSGALVSGLTKNIFMIVTTVVFVVLAIQMVIRLVGIYVLIIFSPLAYVLDILPSTKHFAHEWWEKFVKYLIWAPVSIFMIRITILVVRDTKFFPDDSAFTYVILAAFMAAAYIVAEEAGMAGSHQVVHGLEKAAHWAGHRGLHYAGRKYNEWSTHKFANPTTGKALTKGDRIKFALVNPVAAFKGWSARGEELAHHAQHNAQARGREAMDALATGSTMPWAQFADRAAVNEKLKNYLNMSKEQMEARAVEIENLKGHEGENERLALIKAAFSNGFQDDLMSMGQFAKKYADEDGSMSSATAINRFLYGYLAGDHGVGEQAMAFMAVDLDEISRKTKHPEYMGHSYFDPDKKTFERGMEVVGRKDLTRNDQDVKGGFEELKNTWQASYMFNEWNKMPVRDRIAIAPHALWTQSIPVNDKGDLVDDKGNKIGNGAIKHIRTGRPDGYMDEAQTATLNLYRGSAGEIHHIPGRHAPWAFEGNIDENTGEFHALDKAAIDKLRNAWDEYALPIQAYYSLAIGKNPREHAKEVRGIRAYYNNERGEKVEYNVGDPDSKMLVSEVITSELKGKKNIIQSLSKADMENVSAIIDKVVPAVYMGTVQATDISNAIGNAIGEMKMRISDELREKMGDIAAEVSTTIQTESVAKYNSRAAASSIDYNNKRFSPSDIRQLTKVFSSAYSKGINSVRTKGMEMSNYNPGGGREYATKELTSFYRKELDEKDPTGNYKYNDTIRSVSDAELTKLAKEALP